MKGCSISIWFAINFIVIATFCYVAIVVNFRWKSSRLQPDATPQTNILHPDHTINQRPQVDPTNHSRLLEKLNLHKHYVISQLRFSLINHRKLMLSQHSKTISQFRSVTSRVVNEETPEELLCKLKKHLELSRFKLLDSSYEVFGKNRIWLKKPQLQHTAHSCAIVSSAGAMLHSQLGSFIDDHDIVLRFNNAPTTEYENDVGNRTTIRILNSQILSKPHFQFNNSSLYENLTLIVWDPIPYNSTLENWVQQPDFPFLETFFSRRLTRPEENMHLLDPRGLWDLWHFINQHSSLPIPPNPPSSGFIGLALLLPFCDYVDMVEFVPSLRMTKRCHYYSNHEDLGCTIGEWHPLAAEKLLYLSLNKADEETTFQTGFVRITGFPNLTC